MRECVLVVGDILNGFDLIGPFETVEAADDYAQVNFAGEVHAVAFLMEPE